MKETSRSPGEDMWWKWKEGEREVKKVAPKYSYNSTNRDQYRKPENAQTGQTRHGSNPSSHVSGIGKFQLLFWEIFAFQMFDPTLVLKLKLYFG